MGSPQEISRSADALYDDLFEQFLVEGEVENKVRRKEWAGFP